MVSLMGRSEGILQSLPFATALEETNHGTAHSRDESIPAGRVVDQLGAIKRRTQNRRVRHLAANAAPHTTVIDVRNRIGAQGIRVLFHRERRTPRQANARMVARAGVRINAEALAYDPLAFLDGLF